jgi:hypothetical protein
MADIVALFGYVRMDQPYGIDATNWDTTVTPSVTVAHEINRRSRINIRGAKGICRYLSPGVSRGGRVPSGRMLPASGWQILTVLAMPVLAAA